MTLKELQLANPSTITIQQAAEVMKVTPQFLRAALMQNKFPFGVGVHMEQNEFYINMHRFILYMSGADLGGSLADKL